MNWATPPPYDKVANAEAIRKLYEGWQPMRENLPQSGSYINEVRIPDIPRYLDNMPLTSTR